MIVCKTREELSTCLSERKGGVGFVPTMGALHDGHLSLIQISKSENSLTVCSIFINPTQFNDSTDFAKYPQTYEKDKRLLEENGCDILFFPHVEQMYGRKNLLKFDFGKLENVMEGAMRPGHFNGVATIVAKLFHFVSPDRAYFGQKDLQQFSIINEMVETLSFNIDLRMCPIIREKNGLAMSSRNARLTASHRDKAKILFATLCDVKELVQKGEDIKDALKMGIDKLGNEEECNVEYLKIVDQLSLQEISVLDTSKKSAICVAAFFGEIRLIDNLVF